MVRHLWTFETSCTGMHLRATDRAAPRTEWWWIFDPRYSLRAQAALIVGGGALAFTFALSAMTGVIYQRALQGHLGAMFETLAFQVADKLDRTIYERYRALQFTADLDPLRAAGRQPEDCRRVFQNLQAATPDFAWIGFVDTSGRVVTATNRRFEGTSVALRPWFNGARAHAFVGAVREIPELGREILATDDGESSSRFLELAVPVLGADGNFAGVLAAYVRWNWARAVQLSVVPATAGREQIGVTVYTEHGEVLLDSGASGWTHPPDRPGFGQGRQFRGSLVENTAGGSSYLSGFARSAGFREYRGLGWLAVVRQPVGLAFGPVSALRRSIGLWGFVLSIVAATTAWIVAGRHARRLVVIGAAAERIREGDILTVLPHPSGESELAHMSRAVGELVEDLRGRERATSAENAPRMQVPPSSSQGRQADP